MATENNFSSINSTSVDEVVARIGSLRGDVLIVRATGDIVTAKQGEKVLQY